MKRQRVIAWLLAAVVAAASLAACPVRPFARDVQAAGSTARRHDHHPRFGTTRAHAHADCADAERSWAATCPCGCGERPAAAPGAHGLDVAIASRAPEPPPWPEDAATGFGLPILPSPPSSGLDPVPRRT